MTTIAVRPARPEDVPAIVALLADDALGAGRESPEDLTPYRLAFDRVQSDPNQCLVVADRDGDIVGTLQLTIVPGLSRKGATRSIIEGVRVHSVGRGQGLGRQLIEWAIAESRRRQCRLVQLTSDVTRVEAHRFYEGLGFTASHVGFKLPL